jgi:transcriptional regulator GlxA family with amidase domain
VPDSERIRPAPDARATLEEGRQAKAIDAGGRGGYSRHKTRIAIAAFDAAEELDFAGPWEVLAAWRFLYPDDVEVVLVGENSEPVTCAKGMRVLPETCWDQLGDVDVLVPSVSAQWDRVR